MKEAGSIRSCRPLAAIVLIAAGVRVAAVLWIPTQPVSDFYAFREFGLQLLRTGTMPNWCAMFGPGYPVWLAAVAGVFGTGLFAARLANAFLSTLTVGLAGALAWQLFGRRSGLVAAGLLCIDPRQILQTCLLASENLSGPLTFAFLLIVACSWRKPDASWTAVLAGALLGLAALARPATRPLFLLWPVTALVAGKRTGRVLKETSVLAAVVFAVLLPWGAWNMRHNHRWIFSTTSVGLNLFMGNHAGATGDYFDWLRALQKIRPDLDTSDLAGMDRFAGEQAKSWIGSHPAEALRLYVRKLRLFFWERNTSTVAGWAVYARAISPPTPPIDVLPGPHLLKTHVWGLIRLLGYWYFGILAGGSIAVVVLGLRIIRRMEYGSWPAVTLIVGACASFPLLTCAFIVVDHYRWPFEDLLCVLIASLLASRVAPPDALSGGGA